MLKKLPWIRLLSAGVLLVLAFSSAAKAVQPQPTQAHAYFAVIFLVSAAIVLGATFVEQFSSPLTRFIDYIYFGSGRVDEAPPVNLRLVRAYRAERCYARAVAECERQMEWHSLVPALWAELVLAHRGASGTGSPSEQHATERALMCLGLSDRPERFDQLLRERNDLPVLPAGMMSQFER